MFSLIFFSESNVTSKIPTHKKKTKHTNKQNKKKKRNKQQEAHGPHRSPEKTVQIIKRIRLYHNVD